MTIAVGPGPRKSVLFPATDDRGQGLAEYIIVVVLVGILILVGIRYFGSGVQNQFQSATETIRTAKDDTNAPRSDQQKSPTEGASHSTSENVALPDQGASSSSPGGAGKANTAQTSGGDQGGGNLESLRAGGVGDDDGNVVNVIQLDWKTLLILGGIAVAIGVYLVLKQTKENRPVKKKKKKKKLFSRDDQQGQAMVEFVFSAITLFFVLLGVIQLAMVLNAQSLVRYAAYNAARAGIVHAHDPDHMREKMQEAARISLLPVFPRHGRADHPRGFIENYTGAKDTDSDASLTFFNEPITEAKVLDNNGLSSGDVVTFDDFLDSEKAVITVQVVHRYELVIPLVNRILFYLYTKYRSGEGYQGQTADHLARVTDTMRRTGAFKDIEYRIPLVAHYTMRLQSDYVVP